MIYKIIKENCYSLISQRFLKNKFTRVAGEIFSRYKDAETIQLPNGLQLPAGWKYNATQLGEVQEVIANQGKVHWIRVHQTFYTTITITNIESQSDLPQEISDYEMQISVKSDRGSSSTRVVTWINAPPTFSLVPSDSYIMEHIGKATGIVTNIKLRSFDLTLKIISKVAYIDYDYYTETGGWLIRGGWEEFIDQIEYVLKANTIHSAESTFYEGSQNVRQEFSIQGNELLDSEATFKNENGTVVPLVSRLASIILRNYKNGKQVINFAYSLHALESIDGKSKVEIFNVGMYIQVFDDFGNAVFKYINTDKPKTFEIVDCSFANAEWNIIAKEVANA